MTAEKRSPNIVFANANIADPRYPQLFRVLPKAVGRFALESGFDGVEWHPVMDWLASPQAIALAIDNGDLVLNSLHASFRTTDRSKYVNVPGGEQRAGLISKLIASPLGRILMPELVSSAGFMRAVQRQVGPRPCVLYAHNDPVLGRKAIDSGPGLRLVQATDQVASILRARTPEAFLNRLIAEGYDGVIIDTHHMHPERYNGDLPRVVSNLDRSLPILQPFIRGVHASFNRQDAASSDAFRATTRQSLVNALDGVFTDETNTMMSAAWEAPHFEYVVLEATAPQLAEVTQHRGTQLAEDYAVLADGLRAYQP